MTDFEKLNHSTSHLMAEAISHLYPEAKFGFGPAIEEGFYYDVDFPTPITEEDLPAIEAEMRKIAAKNAKFERIVVSKEEAKKLFKDNPYKLELIDGIEGEISIYKQGEWFDLCAGDHVESTGKIQNFKLLNIAGAYWRVFGHEAHRDLAEAGNTLLDKGQNMTVPLVGIHIVETDHQAGLDGIRKFVVHRGTENLHRRRRIDIGIHQRRNIGAQLAQSILQTAQILLQAILLQNQIQQTAIRVRTKRLVGTHQHILIQEMLLQKPYNQLAGTLVI